MACVIRVENTNPEMYILFHNGPKSDSVLKTIVYNITDNGEKMK